MTIIWTQKALNSYFNIADYLLNEWGETVLKDFADKVEKVIHQIEETPNMFEVSKK